MASMMSVCGVMCSDCPAYLAAEKGPAHQQRTAAAWKRIYGYDQPAEAIACAGCLGADAQVFHTCRSCGARTCCRSKGFTTCAECPEEKCAVLEKAQSNWDGVPNLVHSLSSEDFALYAQAYCDHRRRLAEARASNGRRSH